MEDGNGISGQQTQSWEVLSKQKNVLKWVEQSVKNAANQLKKSQRRGTWKEFESVVG